MYFGKTNADHTTNTASEMVSRGGGSCQGFTYNRSAYWMPALMTDPNNAVVPNEIIVYYKTKVACPNNHTSVNDDTGGFLCENSDTGERVEPLFSPEDTAKMQQGLQLFSGNPGSDDLTDRSGTTGIRASIRKHRDGAEGRAETPVRDFKEIYWSCAKSGLVRSYFNQIPTSDDMRTDECRDGDGFYHLNATVYFPQCVLSDTLTGSAPRRFDHTLQIPDGEACPDGYDTIPRLGILAYWYMDEDRVNDLDNWFLSSDHREADGSIDKRGGTLHADWIGGWHDDVQDAWLTKCLKESKNCTNGQTGTPSALNNLGEGQDRSLRDRREGSRENTGVPNGLVYSPDDLPATKFFFEHGVSLPTSGM